MEKQDNPNQPVENGTVSEGLTSEHIGKMLVDSLDKLNDRLDKLEKPVKVDIQRRKYHLTLNNPLSAGWDHERIKRTLLQFKSCIYWCMADEVGLKEQTPHTHIFMAMRTPTRFTTVKNLFPEAHIEAARGTAQENRAYIEKSGKWAEDEKADTSVPGTFEEWGEPPEEVGQGFRSDIAELYQDIDNGLSNAEIMKKNPEMAKHIGKMDKIRQDILEDLYRTTRRKVDVTYIFGPTGTGKTRYVLDTNGYASVYRVTDYKHSFDSYKQEPILCLDEFRSSLPISELLNYLDGYPLNLPARYANRVACYTKVYIISNIDLKQQYVNVQDESEKTWDAFLRRIHHVIEYRENGDPVDHGSGLAYINRNVPKWVHEAEQTKEEAVII